MTETASPYATRAKDLARAHWSYIEGILKAHDHVERTVVTARYHYLTAFEHGYKHAIEDAESGMYSDGGLGGK